MDSIINVCVDKIPVDVLYGNGRNDSDPSETSSTYAHEVSPVQIVGMRPQTQDAKRALRMISRNIA